MKAKSPKSSIFGNKLKKKIKLFSTLNNQSRDVSLSNRGSIVDRKKLEIPINIENNVPNLKKILNSINPNTNHIKKDDPAVRRRLSNQRSLEKINIIPNIESSRIQIDSNLQRNKSFIKNQENSFNKPNHQKKTSENYTFQKETNDLKSLNLINSLINHDDESLLRKIKNKKNSININLNFNLIKAPESEREPKQERLEKIKPELEFSKTPEKRELPSIFAQEKDGEKPFTFKVKLLNKHSSKHSLLGNLESTNLSLLKIDKKSSESKPKIKKLAYNSENEQTRIEEISKKNKYENSQLNQTYKIQEGKEAKESENTNNFFYNALRCYATKSKAGRNIEGKIKTNQDNYIVKSNLLGIPNFHIFGIFDGHGTNGHLVSNFVVNFFNQHYGKIENFTKILKNEKIVPTEKQIYEILKGKNYDFISKSFIKCENELSKSRFDVNFSGTTSIICFTLGLKLIVANAGDSRAIMIIDRTLKESQDSSEWVLLSRDHKPDLEDEKQRIINNNGRIERYSENGIKSGPYRVWLKHENIPGLAMSRSIGDFVAGSVGCTCNPEIYEFEITEECLFMVVASDGVWEFLSNEDVKEIIFPFYKNNDPVGAIEKLIEEAVKMWNQEDQVIDDITATIIFLNKPKDSK